MIIPAAHLRGAGARAKAALALLPALVAVVAMGFPTGVDAKRPLRLGYADGSVFGSTDAALRARWLGLAAADGASLALRVIAWRQAAPASPSGGFDATDPGDPEYHWAGLDMTIRDTVASGLSPVITVTSAPAWAEGPGRPPSAPQGTWKPQGSDLKDFATALARRYSGSFPDPEGGLLPRVVYFQAWTEPNLSDHLSPQWKGEQVVAGSTYRGMLNSFYAGVKSVNPSNRVITAGTAPYGDPPGGSRSRPLRFLRELLCLSGPKLQAANECPNKAKFDILAHHPINTSGGPHKSALHPDDVSSADLRSVTRTVRAAERRETTASKGRHPLWATEFWWQSNPPTAGAGVKPLKQARYIAESLYMFWRAGASAAINLRIRDGQSNGSGSEDFAGTGTYFFDGSAKPAARAFAFPFVADVRGGAKIRVWGKAPAPGKVTIERKRGSWKPARTLRAGRSRIFSGRIRAATKGKLRARAAGEKSLSWTPR